MSGEGTMPSARMHDTRFRRGTISCPVCNAHARICGNEQASPFVKILWCQCTNVDCGMTWRMDLSLVHIVSPSAITHDLDLPPPPNGFRHHTYPAGPPSQWPDPNQTTIFDICDDDDPSGSQADQERSAA
ncbi:MAG: ogr/Delta-like zinc finger family protein [Caenibius sp.]